MSNRNLNRNQVVLMVGSALICALSTTACGSNNNEVATPTKQGTISLQALRVGMPESSIKDALMTFVEDPKGSFAGKVQYLSRAYDKQGGQYLVQCKDGQVFGLQVLYSANPISKEEATAQLKQLFPSGTPAQSRVDDSRLQTPELTEVYYYDPAHYGELVYTDKTATKVKMVSAWLETQKLSEKTP